MIRFKDGGRGPEEYDCWGWIMAEARKMGIDLPDFKISCARTLLIHRQYEVMRDQFQQVEKPERGDIVAMSTDPRFPQAVNHYGIMVDKYKFSHLRDTGLYTTRLGDFPVRGFYRWIK